MKISYDPSIRQLIGLPPEVLEGGIAFYGGDDESGEVFMVETKLKRGQYVGQHAHKHAHLSYLVSGEAMVTVEGISTYHVGPKAITIAAEKQHSVAAVTDIVWLCLWADHLAPKQEAFEAIELFGGG